LPVVAPFSTNLTLGVILRDFSPEGTMAKPNCIAAARKLGMTPGISGRHFKPEHCDFAALP